MKKKLFVVLLSVLLMFLAACSNDSTSSKSSKDGDDVVTIKFFSAHGQFNKGNFGDRQIQAFMEAYPNIKVELTYANGDNFNDTFLALASSNDLPDVFQPTGTFTLNELIENKWVQPLDDLVPDDFQSRFPEGSFAEGINMIEGKMYSFPRLIGKKGSAFFYHTDLMEEAGLDPNKPPKTWDELLDYSKQITEKVDGAYGIAFPLNDSNAGLNVMRLAQALQPTLDTNGFDYQQGQYDLDSPNVVKAIEFFLELEEAGVVHPNSTTHGLLDFQGLWANKQAAFGFNESWFPRVLEFELDGVQDYGVTQIPVPEADMDHRQLSLAADFNAYISADTEHPEEAALLIDWLGSTEFYEKQLSEDLLISPLANVQDKIDNPQLKQLAEVYDQTVVARPVPESNKNAFEAKKIETTLAQPQPQFWQIVQGAYIGEITDWKAELTKLNDAMNERFNQALEKANEEGIEVSKDDFSFPDWDGSEDYTN